MAASTSVHRSLVALAQSWPKDALRPTLQFSEAIQAATERVFGQNGGATLTPTQIAKAEATLASLQRLRNDEALKRYPMSKKTLEPASMPKHYQRMREGIERASRGEKVTGLTWKDWFTWK